MLHIKSLDDVGDNVVEHSCTSVIRNTQYMYICVIIITILNVISTTICVTSCVYFNIPWFAFLEGYLAQVKFIMFMPKSHIILFVSCQENV